LTPTQSILSVAGNSIFGSTGGGSWAPITVSSSFGSTGSVNTTITLAGGFGVVNDPAGLTLPVAVTSSLTLKQFNSSGNQSLPIYTAASYHLNRLFTGGLSTAPSAVNFTAANNIFDSTGTDTGGFTVAIGDGDAVQGLSNPFYGSVYVFKGPQFGSVWQIAGNTPSAFTLSEVAHGAPLLNPKALISTPTDIYWLSNYGVHSLQTTVKFGNVEQAFLSLPIQRLWREGLLTRKDLANAWGFWNPTRNVVGWAVSPSGSAHQNIWLLVYNYALSDPKPGGKKFWSIHIFPNSLASGAVVLSPTPWDPAFVGDPHLWFGESDGQAYVGDRNQQDNQFNDAGAAYTYTITTPTISRYPAPQNPTPETAEKNHRGVVTYFNPHTPGATVTMTVTIDNRQQQYTLGIGGGGALWDVALWDVGLWAGAGFNYVETPIDDRGRTITIQYDQGTVNTDVEIFGYSVRYDAAETLPMEVS
jgi:hypothetical protein